MNCARIILYNLFSTSIHLQSAEMTTSILDNILLRRGRVQLFRRHFEAYMKKGYVSLIIHSSAGHFWGRRAGHGIPDLRDSTQELFWLATALPGPSTADSFIPGDERVPSPVVVVPVLGISVKLWFVISVHWPFFVIFNLRQRSCKRRF